ncbi:uncharacterized protein LOC133927505 [Phragmites australis]|uniref:uncharacterized protein LOC133927505 n=1 Tax=Phragmites australis TaxID=29695 RepID=UPI002D772EC3|nr:uncharacterized protein LOC133927505 [Phragmites australis]
MVLDSKCPNYSKWSSSFESMCGKFGLMVQIDGSTPAKPEGAQWAQANCVVRSWMYSSISDDVLDITMELNQHARALRVTINNEFHSMFQGDLSIFDYCQRLKTLADSLRDVGHSVFEPQLILNMLRGLNSRFSNTADDIANLTPFPSFAKACSMLTLKELRLANEVKVTNLSKQHAASLATKARKVTTRDRDQDPIHRFVGRHGQGAGLFDPQRVAGASLGGRRPRLSWRRSADDQAAQAKRQRGKEEGSRSHGDKEEMRRAPRFAPEFDGIDCFETIVSH